MGVVVRIPSPLRKITGELSEVECSGDTVKDIIEDLEARYPGVKARLCDENGDVRRFINIFVGEEDIRFLDGINTVVVSDQEISIVPAIAGG